MLTNLSITKKQQVTDSGWLSVINWTGGRTDNTAEQLLPNKYELVYYEP